MLLVTNRCHLSKLHQGLYDVFWQKLFTEQGRQRLHQFDQVLQVTALLWIKTSHFAENFG